MISLDLSDRHVVVTGASGGLGSAVVAELVAAGATVHAPLMEAAAPAHATWLAHPQVDARPGVDGGDEAALAAYFASLPPLWASIHLVGGYAGAALIDTSLADFDRMIAMNARTCFLATREAARALRGRGALAASGLPGAVIPSRSRVGSHAAGITRLCCSSAVRVRQ